MKIETIEIAGLAGALKALRLPFGKEMRSDLQIKNIPEYDLLCNERVWDSSTLIAIAEKDLALIQTLVKRGDEHGKIMRGIMVWAEITAPIWFYREMETYRIGRERLASESTMHIECRGLSGEELEKAKDEIPMGHIQKTVDVFSYQTLRRIYAQRKNHRLPAWHQFCDWIKVLPFAEELITVGLDDIANELKI